MQLEFALLTKILETRDFETPRKHRISEELFSTRDLQEMFRFIHHHYANVLHYGEVPSLEKFRAKFALFQYVHSPETLAVLCGDLHEARIKADVLRGIDVIHGLLQKPDGVPTALNQGKELFSSLAMHYEAEDTGVTDFSDAIAEFLDQARVVGESRGLLGIPYPWPYFTQETLGMQKGEFILFYGRPKSMKTWLVLFIAVFAYMQANARVLICSPEVMRSELTGRLVALVLHTAYERVRKWFLLTESERVFAEEFLHRLRDMEEDALQTFGLSKAPKITYRCEGGQDGRWSLDTVERAIDKVEPNLVILDAMSKIEPAAVRGDPLDWKNMARVTARVKQIAKNYGIPVIGTNQAKQSAAKTFGRSGEEHALSDTFQQDCDHSFRVVKRRNAETNGIELILATQLSRSTNMEHCLIHGLPAQDFGFIRTISDEELEEIQEEDLRAKHRPPHTGKGVSPAGSRCGPKFFT